MNLTITTSKKRYQIVCFPSAWEELPTGTYQKLISEWDPDIISLSSKSVDKLFQLLAEREVDFSVANLSTDSKVWQAMSFIYEQPIYLDLLPLPNFFIIEGKKINVKMKIEQLSIGQNIVMKQSLENAKDLRTLLSKAIAIYLQPKVDGAFSQDRVNEIEEDIKIMPITSTYSLGFFLLTRLKSSGWTRPKGWRYLMITLALRGRGFLVTLHRLIRLQRPPI